MVTSQGLAERRPLADVAEVGVCLYLPNHVLKVGVGVGDVSILHVGGVFSRLEYVAVGDPLAQAFHAEHGKDFEKFFKACLEHKVYLATLHKSSNIALLHHSSPPLHSWGGVPLLFYYHHRIA